MKKIIYTLLLSLTLSSCSDNQDIVLENYDSNKKDLINEKRSYGEILNIARSVISVEVDKSTRGEVSDRVSIYPLIGNNTRTDSDTLLYAVDFDDSEGFAIISAYNNAYQYDNSSMTNTGDDISWNESFEYLLYEP